MKKASSQSIYKLKSSDPILGSSSVNNKQNENSSDKIKESSVKVDSDKKKEENSQRAENADNL